MIAAPPRSELATQGKIDYTIACLYALLIVLIVAGHITIDNPGWIDGSFNLFRPYSFHVAGFAFVSGFLYKTRWDGHPVRHLVTRVKRLLIPMYALYAFYGILATVLNHVLGFTLGPDFTIVGWLVYSVTHGEQFVLNYPMWFIAPFCIAQILHELIRCVASKISHDPQVIDVACAAIATVFGIVSVLVGGPEGTYDGQILVFMRPLFLCSWIAIGHVFKTLALPAFNNVRTGRLFTVLIAAKLVILLLTNGNDTYSPAWVSFPGGPIITYATTIVGILFFFRLCQIISPIISRSEHGLVVRISQNTFSIMCHHIFGMWLLNAAICLAHVAIPGAFPGFDAATWQGFNLGYCYFPEGIEAFQIVYIVVGIGFSLGVHDLWTRFKRSLSTLTARTQPKAQTDRPTHRNSHPAHFKR